MGVSAASHEMLRPGMKNQGARAGMLTEKGGCHTSLSEQEPVEVEGWAG